MKRKERPTAAQQKRAEKDALVERLVKSHGMVQLVDNEGNTTGPPLVRRRPVTSCSTLCAVVAAGEGKPERWGVNALRHTLFIWSAPDQPLLAWDMNRISAWARGSAN
jgi:hypothetical protein